MNIVPTQNQDLHTEIRQVHRKTGKTFFQLFHVAPEEKPMPVAKVTIEKTEKKSPKEDLTLMTMMNRYSTEESARKYFEDLRWPDGVECPHCSNKHVYELTPNKAKRIRPGLYKCDECRKTFTVTVGTVMESSHIPLNKWLLAFYMMCASKTQISALQLQRQLGIGSYQTAFFMCHRIRWALLESAKTYKLSGMVEADETYIGGKAKGKGRGYVKNKTPVVSALERGGEVRSEVVDHVTSKIIKKFLSENVDESSNLNTDESQVYTKPGKSMASHDTVNHKNKEYSRYDEMTGRKVTTNSIEGYFGNTKRSISGTHHSISPQHTDLYLAEFDYKHNTRKMSDGERTSEGIPKIEGKRMKRKELFARGKNMKKKEQEEKIIKSVPIDDEMRMPAEEFDAIMRLVFNVPPKDDIKFVKARIATKEELKGKKKFRKIS